MPRDAIRLSGRIAHGAQDLEDFVPAQAAALHGRSEPNGTSTTVIHGPYELPSTLKTTLRSTGNPLECTKISPTQPTSYSNRSGPRPHKRAHGRPSLLELLGVGVEDFLFAQAVRCEPGSEHRAVSR